jgi:outer membrane protein assembly factor BamB
LSLRSPRVAALLLAAWSMSATPAAGQAPAEGQPLEPAQAAPRPDADRAADGGDVYLDDSLEAADAVARAMRMAQRKQWHEAAQLLQATSDSAGLKLMAVAPGQYTAVRAHINSIIAGWPVEGVEAYRLLHERDVEALLRDQSRPRSTEELLDLFELYFCTSSAARLADRIARLAIEAGDLPLAERMYREVLARHPDRSRYEQSYRAMLTVVAALRGEPPADAEIPSDAKVTFQGREAPLRDVLTQIEEGFADLRRPMAPTNWPVFHGDAARSRLGVTGVDELGLAWRQSLIPRESNTDLGDSSRRVSEFGESLTINPVVHEGLVYYQHLRSVWAVRLTTGAEQWRYPLLAADSGAEPESQIPVAQSPTIDRGLLFAALPGPQTATFGYETIPDSTTLVALKPEDGTMVWRRDRTEVAPDLTDVSFDPWPVARDGRVYCVGRRRRSFGFEDAYLFCLKATDGTVLFRTHVGSASTGAFTSRQATMAMPALHGDSVYVCTNLGTITRLSAYNGAVRWLRLYDRERAAAARRSERTVRDVKPWHLNPTIVSGDRVACLPVDGLRLLVLSADDGRVLRSPSGTELGDAVTMLGFQGDLLCTAGDAAACCYDVDRGELAHQWPLPPGATIEGRGVWALDRLMVPMRSGLAVFPLPAGARIDLSWDAAGAGGNLVALPDQLVVAGDAAVSVFVRKSEIWSRLRRAMTDEPENPEPALELVEVAIRAAELDEAQTAMREAVRRAGELATPPEPALKKRFYEDVIALSEMLVARTQADGESLDRLHGYAALTAPDREAHVAYRLRFARWFERLGLFDRTVRLYQQILRDRSLRDLVAAIDDGRSESAGAFARSQIARLISEEGAALYAPYEQEAAALLERGRTAADADMLSLVSTTFPNSTSAPAALLAEADVLTARGDHEGAARRLTTAYQRHAARIDREAVLRRIADAYASAGRVGHAYRWLTKAAREFPSARVIVGTRAMTFLEYRERLKGASAHVEASRPTITLPLDARLVRAVGSGLLLVPRFDSDPMNVWNTAYVYENDAISAYEPQLQKAAWAWPTSVQARPELLIAAEKVAVFATLYEVFGLDPATGKRLWTYGSYPNVVDDAADWEGTGVNRRYALHDGRLAVVDDNGKIICISISDGQMLWERTHPIAPRGPVALSDSWIVYHAMDEERRVVLCVIDATEGAWVGALVTEEQRAVEQIYTGLGGEIVLVTSQSLCAYDVDTMSRRWRVPMQDHLQSSAVHVDLEAVYFSSNNRQLEKLSLQDGQTLWRSEPVMPYGGGAMTLAVIDGSVIVSSESAVAALDAVAGTTLWVGTLPDQPRFLQRLMSKAYVVALDIQPEAREADSAAYFYDHRNASGVIPREGGVRPLGRVDGRTIKAVMLLDGALLIQTDNVIEVWSR